MAELQGTWLSRSGLNWRRTLAAGAAILLGLAVSACLLTPGRFTSSLDLRKDGQFSFAYRGEIHMLALSKLAQRDSAEADVFTPETCHDEDMKERPCRPEELDEQKQTFAQERASKAEKAKRDAESMKAMLGGIDPSNPQAAEELAARLRRQAGWKSVIYKGDGLFMVDFALSGRLDHDFSFPTIERFPMANAFVQIVRRSDGTVRVDAPGFAPSTGAGNPFQAMLSGGMGMDTSDKNPSTPPPVFEGTFVITTDGTVLANNTDEGPQPDPTGQKLSWAVNARSAAAPTALVKFVH